MGEAQGSDLVGEPVEPEEQHGHAIVPELGPPARNASSELSDRDRQRHESSDRPRHRVVERTHVQGACSSEVPRLGIAMLHRQLKFLLEGAALAFDIRLAIYRLCTVASDPPREVEALRATRYLACVRPRPSKQRGRQVCASRACRVRTPSNRICASWRDRSCS